MKWANSSHSQTVLSNCCRGRKKKGWSVEKVSPGLQPPDVMVDLEGWPQLDAQPKQHVASLHHQDGVSVNLLETNKRSGYQKAPPIVDTDTSMILISRKLTR